jgi:hypothetical protein
MSQGAVVIADDDGAAVLAALNAALARFNTTASGTGRPADAVAGTTWLDTNTPSATVWTLNFYDGTSDIALGTFDSTAHTWTPAGAGLLAATQAEMEAGASSTVAATPARQQFHQSACKAWLKADFAGAIQASYNITSVTDVGTGIVGVTIGTDFSSAHYAVTATLDGGGAFGLDSSIDTQAAGSFRILTGNTVTQGAQDATYVHAVCFGDQ